MGDSEFRTSRPIKLAKDYLSTPFGSYYALSANRYLLYLLLTALFFTEALLAFVIHRGPLVLIEFMAFSTVYSLHIALVYSFSIWMADAIAGRASRNWGGYRERTVGKLWLIWFCAFLFGFGIHRSFLPRLVYLYAPEVAEFFMSSPEIRPGHFAFFVSGLLWWCAAVYIAIRIGLKNQEATRPCPRPPKIRRIHQRLSMAEQKKVMAPDAATGEPLPPFDDSLILDVDSKSMEIPLGRISHITIEDHYSRIFLKDGDGLTNVLIRTPLEELVQKLPKNRFLQIHRSHVVNLEHVSRLRKNGRQTKVALDRYGLELPVSRYRLPYIRTILLGMVGE